MELLTQQIKEMQEIPNKRQQVASYELCKGEHPTGYCPSVGEEVNYMGNPNQNQGYQQGKHLIKTTKVTNKEEINKVINKVGDKRADLQTIKILIKTTINLHNLNVKISKMEYTLTQFM